MKVGKEEFAGIYTALKLFLAQDFEAQKVAKAKQLATILEYVNDIPHVKASIEGTELNVDLETKRAKSSRCSRRHDAEERPVHSAIRTGITE